MGTLYYFHYFSVDLKLSEIKRLSKYKVSGFLTAILKPFTWKLGSLGVNPDVLIWKLVLKACPFSVGY